MRISALLLPSTPVLSAQLMPGISKAYVTKCDDWPNWAVLSGIVQYETGDRLAYLANRITMGIVADTFRDRIEEMRRKDEESMAELTRILSTLKGIAKDMEQIELESEY